MIKAIYAGSFDPITFGHLDIIKRSFNFCDKLVIGIGHNPSKKSFFSELERVDLVKTVLFRNKDKVDPNKIDVTSYQGLLVDFAKSIEAKVLIRGIRSVSDFEYEINLAAINKTLALGIETVFLPTSPDLAVVSSSMVKEIAKHNIEVVHSFTDETVVKAIVDKLGFIKYGT